MNRELDTVARLESFKGIGSQRAAVMVWCVRTQTGVTTTPQTDQPHLEAGLEAGIKSVRWKGPCNTKIRYLTLINDC